MLHDKVTDYVQARIEEFDQIPPTRLALLAELTAYVREPSSSDSSIRLTFICTHNSRRSQMAQVWAAVAAIFYDVDRVETYSGGTEMTAFNPRAVAALRRAGLEITQEDDSDNPKYFVHLSDAKEPLACLSKIFTEEINPQSQYVAVMTCSSADRACPTAPGAAQRIAIAYADPKNGDGTDYESELYDERCAEIAREMLYVFWAARQT